MHPTMRTLLACIAALCFSISARAQYVTIPDSNFAVFISDVYGAISNFNQLDTTSASVVNATDLNCNSFAIKDLDGIQYFKNLQSLQCANNSLTSLSSLPPLLKSINCAQNQIDSLPALSFGLEFLDCSYNHLATLPSLPSTLLNLRCSNNQISVLPSLPLNLMFLVVGNNNLTNLPILPPVIISIEARENNLLSLPYLPDSLKVLEVSSNNLTSFSAFPHNLEVINLSDNNISSIPSINSSLSTLLLRGNNLTSLPPLPSNLKNVDIQYNLISTLPLLPSSLEQVAFGYNQLSTFPIIPSSCIVLRSEGNYYTQIPSLPTSIKEFYCGSIYLSAITDLPDSLLSFSCTNSPNLICLPKIGYMQQMTLLNTGVTCFPNYGTIMYSAPHNITSMYPLCNEVNSTCTSYANLAGRVYTDDNHDCTLNNNEVGQANVRQELWSNGTLQKVAYTGGAGYYSFDVDTAGEYTIVTDTTHALFILGCPANGTLYDTLTTNDSIHLDRDFALHCKPGFNLVAHSISSTQIFRPANNTVVDIHAGDLANFYGANCAVGVAGNVRVEILGPATYVAPASGALTPTSVAGNTLTWNVADFANVNFNTSFGIVVQTDTFAQIGQQVCFNLHITPTVGDNDSSNNTLFHCFNIVNSYDPNDKQASPSGLTDTATKWITYTVRFQNTGTAEAQHIYIMDTLDANVDASTFQLLAYSHQPNIQVNEHIIRFNFPFINLPDSNSNELGSHGYVQYKVKMKEGLTLSTEIRNTAYIYFDFNPPVVTNTTVNTITHVIPTGIQQPKVISLNLYPNPASQQLTVSTGQQGGTLALYNAQGMLLNSYTMNGSAQTIDVAQLANGVYYVEVNNKDGIGLKKFMKL